MTATPELLLGKRKAAANLTLMTVDDAFKDTPIYGFNVDEAKKISEGNTFLKNWPVGAMIAGTFDGLKTMKLQEGDDEPRQYLRLVTVDGLKLRAYAPGQLAARVSDLPPGTYIEMVYKGKEAATINGKDRQVHSFDVFTEAPAKH